VRPATRALSPVIRKSGITGPRTRNPPEIPDSCLPARSQEFASVCTGLKRPIEDPVLPSTIRHQYGSPNCYQLGLFLVCLRRFPRVVGGSCGNLWTSPAARSGLSRPHSTLSWTFLAPTSLPETGPKSAKAATQTHPDPKVTRGRIKRLFFGIARGRVPPRIKEIHS